MRECSRHLELAARSFNAIRKRENCYVKDWRAARTPVTKRRKIDGGLDVSRLSTVRGAEGQKKRLRASHLKADHERRSQAYCLSELFRREPHPGWKKCARSELRPLPQTAFRWTAGARFDRGLRYANQAHRHSRSRRFLGGLVRPLQGDGARF